MPAKTDPPPGPFACLQAIFEANKGEIAGLILEPVVGNSGFIPPTKEFLEGLRELCTQVGARAASQPASQPAGPWGSTAARTAPLGLCPDCQAHAPCRPSM